MIEVDALINSRPPTRASSDPDDQFALTWGQFLILCPYAARAPALVNDREVNSCNAWRKAQSLKNMFWQRWLKEYVPNLTERSKWQDSSAREILQQRFGSPFAISQAWLKQLCDREQVKASDSENLRDLAGDLSDATETVHALDLLSEVDSQSI